MVKGQQNTDLAANVAEIFEIYSVLPVPDNLGQSLNFPRLHHHTMNPYKPYQTRLVPRHVTLKPCNLIVL